MVATTKTLFVATTGGLLFLTGQLPMFLAVAVLAMATYYVTGMSGAEHIKEVFVDKRDEIQVELEILNAYKDGDADEREQFSEAICEIIYADTGERIASATVHKVVRQIGLHKAKEKDLKKAEQWWAARLEESSRAVGLAVFLQPWLVLAPLAYRNRKRLKRFYEARKKKLKKYRRQVARA